MCAYGAMCMLDMQCCVQMMQYTCWICNAMYKWCACGTLVLCTHGVVCMIVQVVSCVCGVVYILYKRCCVHVVLCTCCAYGVVYMWCHVHVVRVVLCTCGILYALYSGIVYMWHCVHFLQVVSCTCDVVHTLCRWCDVPMVLCTCCKYGTGAHVVLCACHTCCVEGMWYYVCASCSHGIAACVLIVL